uniref:Phospholipase A2 n=1 Tax=Pavo cristatus TaxID=9049 RepID=A0A8C9EJ47_PAVCR
MLLSSSFYTLMNPQGNLVFSKQVLVFKVAALHFLSQTDCYVSLWLPTASADKFQTKTIRNCKDPVWNETFYFRIQSQVKNVLELGLYDKDVVTQDDHLFTVYFDIAKLSLGEQVFMHFKFLITKLLCLLLCSFLEKQFSFKVQGSYEGTQDITLGSDPVFGSPYPVKFHYAKYKQPTLDLMLPGKKPPPSYYFVGLVSLFVLKIIAYLLNIMESFISDLCSSPDHLDVRLGFDLCIQEQDFLRKRQKCVAAALKKVLQLDKDLLDHETPVVAIMTTGGGMRSLTALYGSLQGLKKLHVLDCATYLTGLSGTTCTQLKKIIESQNHIIVQRKYYSANFCLNVTIFLGSQKDNHKLSDQQRAIDRGQNPLPIYTAVNVKNNYSTLDFKEWVEFTPYEVGLQKYGVFVHSEDFGSEFFMGRLMKKLPESRICFLEGTWSSLFSLNMLYIWNLSHSSEDFWHRWTQDKMDDVEEEPLLPLKPHDLRTRLLTPASPLSSAIRDALTDRFAIAQEHNFLKGLQVHNDYLENRHFRRWKDTVLDTFPNQLTQSEEYLSLVDTGFFINTSIMPLLKPERNVDVILHLNYSAGSQTLALDQTCKYCSEQGILFPKVDLSEEDRKNLKECYLFEDAETPGAPILLFFPLINDTFKNYKAPGQKRSESEMEDGKVDLYGHCSPYSTYSVTYTEKAYDRLVQLGEYNILNNEMLIIQALHTAVERKRQKKK